MIGPFDTVLPLRPSDPREPENYGLTKRELFAAHLASNPAHLPAFSDAKSYDIWARKIWKLADALARNA